MDVGSLLREEGKEKTGHLDHTLHLIGDLNNLHEQLLQAPAGEHYRELYAHLQPELPRLRQLIGRQEISDTELAFRTLYAAMLYRMKGDKTKEKPISDVIEARLAGNRGTGTDFSSGRNRRVGYLGKGQRLIQAIGPQRFSRESLCPSPAPQSLRKHPCRQIRPPLPERLSYI